MVNKVGNDKRLNVIEIGSSDKRRVFFSILFAAVHCPIKKPFVSRTPGAVPFQNQFVKLGKNCRTFCCKDKVRKL